VKATVWSALGECAIASDHLHPEPGWWIGGRSELKICRYLVLCSFDSRSGHQHFSEVFSPVLRTSLGLGRWAVLSIN